MAHTVINEANIPRAIRYKLFGKVSKTATKVDQPAVIEIDGVNSYPAIRSVGQNPKKNKIKKPVDLTSAYLAF